jgi:branched-chain amino acid transport system ATP-binding protein
MTEASEAALAAPGAVTAPAPLLSVRNIEVVYDDVILVLRGLSLEVPQGAIVALLGANGAGKSTTLKAISGLLKTEDGEVTRGEIIFNGERINGIDPDKIVRRGIIQVMEGRRIISDMTSLENLRRRSPLEILFARELLRLNHTRRNLPPTTAADRLFGKNSIRGD